jgi:hypothetical protein
MSSDTRRFAMRRRKAISVLSVMALLAINLIVLVPPASACIAGCTPGYWKQEQHFDNWWGYDPNDSVGDVFSEAAIYGLGSDTLLDALDYPGGPDADGAARILLRAATALLLNSTYDAAHGGGWWYSYWTPAQIASDVNHWLAAGVREDMLARAELFDAFNNLGCPLD